MDKLITNATASAVITLSLLLLTAISAIQLVSQYAEIQHQAENLSIKLAQSMFTDSPKTCQDLKAPPETEISDCRLSQESVLIRLNREVPFLGRTWEISADSRVGYGFYSQNGS